MKPHEIPGNDKYFFYIKKKYFTKQLSYYKLFVVKHGIPVETLVECLEEVRLSSRSNSKRELLSMMGFYFDDLIKAITAKTGKTFKKRHNKHEYTYDDWYDEASMDGSLAYNNSADDL